MSLDTESFILHAIYEKIEAALIALEAGDSKTSIVQLRQILPRGYAHSFEKPRQ